MMVGMGKDLTNKTVGELGAVVGDLGGKSYFGGYIFSFIHTRDVVDISEITPLPKVFRGRLVEEGYYIGRLGLVDRLEDPDGTVKFVFELHDGPRVETVLMRGAEGSDRNTLCISCQAGCRMGCSFCATGKLKFGRNLTAGEIVDQVNYVWANCGRISNVVYMGMGEPMDNYDEVLRSVRILNDKNGKNIGQRRITISTCGVTGGIERLAGEGLQVRLGVSLHAATDETRKRIMPIAGRYPLVKLIGSTRKYQRVTGRRVTFEYCMIKGINDSNADAAGVVKLIGSLKANVNLIEYNSHKGCSFSPSDRARIHRFRDILTGDGIETVIRYKRGRSINAACGQLGLANSKY